MNAYDKGDVVRLTAAFTTSGSAVDPTTVALSYQKPRGSVFTLTYAGGGVIRSSLGNYYADITLDRAGMWHYEWISTGTGRAAESGRFVCRSSALDPNDP